MTLIAYGEYIQVRIHMAAERGGLHLPDKHSLQPHGEVISKGASVSEAIQPGDKLVFMPSAAIEMEDGTHFITEASVLGQYVD
jgi:hypothetical protein